MIKAIDFKDVSVKLDNQLVLENVTFSVEPLKFLTVIGPNGAGKTTLLKTILGLLKPSTGEVHLFGKRIDGNAGELRKMIGYVPQKEYISRNIPVRVWDVVALGRSAVKGFFSILTRRDYKIIKDAIDLVGLYDLRFKRFSHLSGGQQQRALIARALALEPKILLLDEALSGVDITSEEIIISTLGKIKEKGVTIVYVTHDLNEVIDLTDYILVLNKKMIAFGKPEDVLDEKILSQAYGSKVKIIWKEDKCFAILGDKHA